MSVKPRILVIGGTRGTGSLIVRRLLREGHPVRALARDAARARETLGAGVEIVPGDITRPETLPAALRGVDHLFFTAGVTGRFAGEPLVIATIFDGLRNTLAAARETEFQGRFLYMTTVGVTRWSPAAAFLDLTKRNLLSWRREAEAALRRSGFDYTIVRAGILTDDPAGRRGILISQDAYPLDLRYRISRADVAEVLVQTLEHPGVLRTTFNVVGTAQPGGAAWDVLLGPLQPDS